MKSCLLSLLILLAQHIGSAQTPAHHRFKLNLSGLADRQVQLAYEFRKSPRKSLEITVGAQYPAIDHSQVFYGQWVTYYAYRQAAIDQPAVEYEGTGRRLADLPAYIVKHRFFIKAGQRYSWRLPKRKSLELFVQPSLGLTKNTTYHIEDFTTTISQWKELWPTPDANPANYRESVVTYYRQSRLMNLESFVAPVIDLSAGLAFTPWRGLVIEGRLGAFGEWWLSAPTPKYKFLYLNSIEPSIMLLAGWAF